MFFSPRGGLAEASFGLEITLTPFFVSLCVCFWLAEASFSLEITLTFVSLCVCFLASHARALTLTLRRPCQRESGFFFLGHPLPFPPAGGGFFLTTHWLFSQRAGGFFIAAPGFSQLAGGWFYSLG